MKHSIDVAWQLLRARARRGVLGVVALVWVGALVPALALARSESRRGHALRGLSESELRIARLWLKHHAGVP
jgi:hypothetical protein